MYRLDIERHMYNVYSGLCYLYIGSHGLPRHRQMIPAHTELATQTLSPHSSSCRRNDRQDSHPGHLGRQGAVRGDTTECGWRRRRHLVPAAGQLAGPGDAQTQLEAQAHDRQSEEEEDDHRRTTAATTN